MTNTSILTLDSVSLALPDGRLLFTDLSETFDQRRTGLGRKQRCEHMLVQFRGALVVTSHDQVLLDQLVLDEYLHL